MNQVSADETKAHLARLLASPCLRSAPRQQRLLRHLVDATLAADTARLKGYAIALEVFDQPPEFSATESALVRVEVARLRSKLLEYYASGEGSDDAVRFEVPKGHYGLHISRQSGTAIQPPRRAHDHPSLAVLPFCDLSSNHGQDHLAEAIAEDLIIELSKQPGLFVASRFAARIAQGGSRRAEDFARDLGVRYLLAGSVRCAHARVRITARLIDSAEGQCLWAERYDRTLDDSLALEEEIAHCIAGAVVGQLARPCPAPMIRAAGMAERAQRTDPAASGGAITAASGVLHR